MQNSNLSSKIFPNLREDWLLFINQVSHDFQGMITAYNNDKQRVKHLEDNVISKMRVIRELSKDNPIELLNNKELFKFVDNSKELEETFETLSFFKSQNNLDNPAVRDICNKILTSTNIIEVNSEYNSLVIKTSFDKERIKKLSDLIRGSKIDYTLIRDLVDKYNLTPNQKKNILFYPVVMLSIKQNDLKSNKENKEKRKLEKIEFYRNRFNELVKEYHDKKDSLKDLLIKCFNVREQMDHSDINTYNSFVNNPDEINEYEFSDDIKFKIYTLAFFKLKKDIECFIDGITDLLMDDNDLDDELAFFEEIINEFDNIANKLHSFVKVENKISDEIENNVFFALDAFNRLIIKEELLSPKNRSSIKALLQKASTTNNSKIDGAKTSHMLGVSEAEKQLGKNISILITSKILFAYVMIGKNILIIAGDTNTTDKFDKIVNRLVDKNIVPLRRQISMIEENDLDYIDLQKDIVKTIVGEELEEKSKAM